MDWHSEVSIWGGAGSELMFKQMRSRTTGPGAGRRRVGSPDQGSLTLRPWELTVFFVPDAGNVLGGDQVRN